MSKLTDFFKQFRLTTSIVITATCIFAGLIIAQTQTNKPLELRWQKVDEYAEKQLPESALRELDEIIRQTKTDSNTAEFIKAQLYKMRFMLEKEPDKTPELIRDFENQTEKTTAPADRALMQSMLAEMYTRYYLSNAWNINRRTQIEGSTPDDMNQWTKNHYFEKINNLLNNSLSNEKVLKTTNTLVYGELLNKGDDSRSFRPTLFDFLGYRKIDLLNEIYFAADEKKLPDDSLFYAPATEFSAIAPDSNIISNIEYQILYTYQKLIRFHTADADPHALVYNDINRLKYVYEKTNNAQRYLRALTLLEKKYTSNEMLVEILYAQADFGFSHLTDDNFSAATKKSIADICKKGINEFPNYKRIGILKNLLAQIEQKSLTVTHQAIAKPNSTIKLQLSANNIFDLKIETYRVNATAKEYFLFKQNNNGFNQFFPNRTLVATQNVSLTKNDQYLQVDTTLQINTGNFGIYEVVIADANQTEKPERSVSGYITTNIGFIQRVIREGEQQLYTLDRWSGQQLKNVSINTYNQKWNDSKYNLIAAGTSKSGKTGLVVSNTEVRNYESRIYFFENGNDRYFSTNLYSFFNEKANPENVKPLMQLFTDRAIYRPGQTVYFKGIAYFSNAKNNSAQVNAPYEVSLYNANNEKISSVQLKTNEFGSIAGEFTLPANGLNGAYSIRTGNKWHNIYVEEYKRPTFEINIGKTTKELHFGETVSLQGEAKAYAGYAVANARVKYKVTRSSHSYCWWCRTPEVKIASGELTTNDAGKFNIEFKAEKPLNANKDFRGNIYTYTVSADITDNKGETRQGEQSVSVGDKALFILTSVPEKINKTDGLNLKITTETINDEKVNTVLNFRICSLQTNDFYAKNESQTTVTATVAEGKFNTADKSFVLDTKNFKSGLYRLVLSTKDSFGNEVKTENDFILFGNDDKRPPIKTYTWLQTEKTELTVGEKTAIHFGTSTQNTPVLYELMLGNKLIESKWITFNNEIKDFTVIFKEEYGAGLNAHFTFMKDGELRTETVTITRKSEKKELTPTLSVFRDKLQPGEKAEWTITIPESVEKKKAAELMIGMYDASLDAIRSHSWSFSPAYVPTVPFSPLWTSVNTDFSFGNLSFEATYQDANELKYDELNWFGLNVSGSTQNDMPTIRIRGTGSINTELQGRMPGVVVMGYATKQASPPPPPAVAEDLNFESDDIKKPEVKVRTNFNETAFFYPQLRTDANGQVKVSFTAPESLTRWNVKMLAHTPDLFSGYAQSQVITQKELMVQMSLPRFIRRSDVVTIGASVINLSDKTQPANVHFEISDPVTSAVLFLADKKIENIPASQNKAVDFEIPALKNNDLVVCKITAATGNFSDGEQKYLPVLPDKVLVTETLPVTVRANSTRSYRFEGLLKAGKDIENKNFAIEMASNPTWYAVQALPSLAEPENNNAFDLTAAIYANTLAAFIAQSNSGIVSAFNQWKQSENTSDALKSQLSKNQELKNMLLDETPWVMAAGNDAEQKQRIAQLFDHNKQNYQAEQLLTKLLKLQTTDGGFAWFDGMPASRYITQEILLQTGRLARLTSGNKPALFNARYESAIKKALTYLDMEIARDFAELKKYNKNYLTENCTGNMQLFYLHLRSEFNQYPVHVSATDAVRYYTQQSEKYWASYTLYGKAMMAVVAYRNGKISIAGNILKSLRENALKTDESGMYWAKNTAGYFWNERPVAVQAAIIEAFSETGATAAELDELKIWLLRQKQTQHWDSPIASANAVYALLLHGSDWLSNKANVQLQYGSEVLHSSATEAGTGYMKTSVTGNNIKPEMGNITVRSDQQSGISWGAAYWQYYQDVDKVSAKGAGLRVSKTLYVKSKGSSAAIPLAQAKLKTGDRVMTRLVVSTDRNLEFVTLKDLRAACFEPVEQRSGCAWKEGVCYYQTTKDASTQFFFNFLPKGTYVFEYEQWVNNAGTFSSGIATVQCQYAPEFAAHSSGEKLTVSSR